MIILCLLVLYVIWQMIDERDPYDSDCSESTTQVATQRQPWLLRILFFNRGP